MRTNRLLLGLGLGLIFTRLLVYPVAAQGAEEIKTYRLEIEIAAPADFIYPYLIEEDKIARWNRDDSVQVTFPRGLEPRIGKQIKVSLNVPTHPWFLMEIVLLDPAREVKTKFIDGVLSGEFVYRLEPLPNGRTRLLHEMRIKPVGALTTIVWELFGKKLHHEKMRNFMVQIRQVVENDRPALKSVDE